MREGDEALAPVAPESEYDEAIDRAFATARRHRRRAVREWAKVPAVVEVLKRDGLDGFRDLPRGRRGLTAYEALLQRSWELRHEDPQLMVTFAMAAAVTAAKLEPEIYGAEQVFDFRCRAAVELGHAHRVANQLREAQAALREAIELFGHGSRNDRLAARLFEVEAGLCADRRDFENAFAALDGALTVYRRSNDPHLIARALIKKGIYTGYAGRPEEAIGLLTEGLALVLQEDDRGMALAALHGTAWFMVDCGQYREARTLVWRHLSLYEELGGQMDRLKLCWLEGRIHGGLQKFEQAEQALYKARMGFEQLEQTYDTALVTLDLAVLALKRGRVEQGRVLAMEAADRFLSLEIHREAAVSLMLLKSTLDLGLFGGVAALEKMARFMRRIEHDPTAKFSDFLV